MKPIQIDRSLQLQIISLAASAYPSTIPEREIPKDIADVNPDKLVANIAYLKELELITGGNIQVLAGIMPALETVKATYKGVDFLLEDGGLSAVLNVVTIKIHDDSIAKITEFISLSSASPEDKKKLIAQLKSLPADATKHIVLKLLDQGLTQMPNVIQWLQTVLHSA